MQDQTIAIGRTPPEHILNALIDRHGARATLRALARALIWRRRHRANIHALPDHLRRDIGLPERGEPPPRLRDLWM